MERRESSPRGGTDADDFGAHSTQHNIIRIAACKAFSMPRRVDFPHRYAAPAPLSALHQFLPPHVGTYRLLFNDLKSARPALSPSSFACQGYIHLEEVVQS